jgi:hypothetical protein
MFMITLLKAMNPELSRVAWRMICGYQVKQNCLTPELSIDCLEMK